MLMILCFMMTQKLVGAGLKGEVKRGTIAEYVEHKVRTSLYRPFTKLNLYFDRTINDVVYVFPSIFPTYQRQKRKIE